MFFNLKSYMNRIVNARSCAFLPLPFFQTAAVDPPSSHQGRSARAPDGRFPHPSTSSFLGAVY